MLFTDGKFFKEKICVFYTFDQSEQFSVETYYSFVQN